MYGIIDIVKKLTYLLRNVSIGGISNMQTYGLEKLGIINASAVYRNLTPAQLTEHALRRGEGTLSNTGALVVKTGKYTGRSANDKFIVDTPAVHDEIAWGKVNRPIEKAKYEAIKSKEIGRAHV